jgi:hypothetical protein
MNRARLLVGRHEPSSPGPSVALGSLLALTCVGDPDPTHADSVSFTMSASMSKTIMSPDFWQTLEEYREFPVLWQVRSVDYSNRANRNEAWVYSCSSGERKSLMLTCVLIRKECTVSGHHHQALFVTHHLLLLFFLHETKSSMFW